jgi:hypothetical protein
MPEMQGATVPEAVVELRSHVDEPLRLPMNLLLTARRPHRDAGP